ncbi:hypothetical protein G4V39_04475 [Thermosulfuriphilus ammonigenes]|uniref:Uncharacterized protein n=1 Tax=Thermosulfuriphilus ammonigenes TaxID=1936021 RepID=A0A6G7PV68_9BACT|nr:hypothetical protein [Thermosulfuriphilus ammonigenes]MBA2848262.1 hypothetical protein [Thermosulfuriphilus ammonigenes]QIJ71575.1 hypothetical protein G4V39_04475 [Thermosulfuriphilus ammonigenes]
MTQRLNCWEFKRCGRQGTCPASTEKRADGINGGKNGGRACWAIAGTFCGGKIQGVYSQKLASCLKCDFYKLVLREEGKAFIGGREIVKRLES